MHWCVWKGKWNEKRWWKNKQKDTEAYVGRRFSILGDSISTLNGYNPKGYPVFYTYDKAEVTGVLEAADTWWGKVIDFFGGELLINNSWSGSRVAELLSSEKEFPSACSGERTGGLHVEDIDGKCGAKPDVILIYMGTNDWGFGTPVRQEKSSDRQGGNGEQRYKGIDYKAKNTKLFDIAYDKMLRSVRKNYPSAEIWCCSLTGTCMSGNKDFLFPYSYAGIHMEEYNRVICDVAKGYRAGYINLYGNPVSYDTIDGIHPNRQGMSQLAEMVIQEMSSAEFHTN